MGLLEIVIAAVGLTIAFVTYRTNRRSTQIAEETARSDSMKRLKESEELGRQRAAETQRRLQAKNAKPTWPEIEPTGLATDRNVVGRTGDVAKLRQTLTGTGAAAITPGTSGGAVVKGRGGMGKTTLARHYIQTHRSAYHGIWWLRAQARMTVIEDLAKLARRVDVDRPGDDDTANAERALGHLQQQRDPWLLVYDNAEHIDDLRDLLPERDTIHILLTSREGNWPQRFTEQPADALPEDQAIELLRQESGRDGDADGAKALVVALDRLPLAIVAAGAWLRDVSEASERFGDYQTRLEERIHQNPLPESEYPDSVFASIQLSLDKLSANAALLMKLFCWLSPDDLWPGLVTGVAEKEAAGGFNDPMILSPIPEELWTLARDGSAVDKIFAELKSRSLMDSDGHGRWWIHRLTQAAQQSVLRGGSEGAEGFAEVAGLFRPLDSVPGEDPGPLDQVERGPGSSPGPRIPKHDSPAETHRRIAAAMLAASYPFYSDFRENWPPCARLDAHVAALADNYPPATAAMEYLLNQASGYLDAQRMDDRALRYSEESLRLTEVRLGADHEEVGAACNNLAGQYWRLGRMVEAEAMAARAVEIETDHPNVTEASFAISLSTHGLMAGMVGRSLTGEALREKLDLAEQRYEQALEIGDRLHGRQSREVATHLNNLAELHAWQGKWEQAIAGHAEATAIRREVLDAGDSDVPAGLHNLAATLLQSGRVRQGQEGQGVLDLLQEALEIYEDAFERVDHPDRVNTARWLASAHWALLALEAEGDGVKPSAARALALCETYGLDVEHHKALADHCVHHARLHAAGQVVPGQMQLQQSAAQAVDD